ncbi:hypothetical protein [Thermus aquaticus]|nr:hypothetical protein [Thermus aquaticus]
MALLLEGAGLPRMAGRVLAWLLAADLPRRDASGDRGRAVLRAFG